MGLLSPAGTLDLLRQARADKSPAIRNEAFERVRVELRERARQALAQRGRGLSIGSLELAYTAFAAFVEAGAGRADHLENRGAFYAYAYQTMLRKVVDQWRERARRRDRPAGDKVALDQMPARAVAERGYGDFLDDLVQALLDFAGEGEWQSQAVQAWCLRHHGAYAVRQDELGRLIEVQGQEPLPLKQVAKELGTAEGTVYRWLKDVNNFLDERLRQYSPQQRRPRT